MPNQTPHELADQNLRHICAVLGASYSPDHSSYSPLGDPDYPGPWVRITLAGADYYITAGYVVQVRGNLYQLRTCYYPYPSDLAACPNPELVASALLLLRNDPTIFDRWCLHQGAFS